MWVLGGFWKLFPDENWATLLSTCSANDKNNKQKVPKMPKRHFGTFEQD